MADLATIRLDVYLVTDSRLAGAHGIIATVTEALGAGATVVQLREKDLSTRKLVELGLRLRAETRRFGVPLIVNDRLDVELAIDADGLHVGQDDLSASVARRLLGSDRILGVSATTLDEAVQAWHDGADYLGVGPIYPTDSKADAAPATGTRLVSEAKRATSLPIVAIGGINIGNAANVVAAGADGVAVISAIVGQPNPAAATRELADVVAAGKANLAARGGGSSWST